MLVGALHRFAAVGFVVMLVEGSVLRAEPAPDTVAGRVVTLDEALLAVEAAPDVVAARANERAAAARIGLARTAGEPSLIFETHSITAHESVMFSLPFRWGGQKAAAVRTAVAERDTAARSGEVALATARRAVRVAWFTLAAGEDRLRAAKEQLARAERNRDAITDLLGVGRASRLDAARATTEAATATATLAKAEQEVVAASGELRALLGVEDRRLSVGGAKTVPPLEGSLEAWRGAALQRSPEMALATSELHVAEAAVAQRERDKLPTTSLEAGADWNDPTQPGTDAKLGLGITFPTRSRAALDVAHADQDRATALLGLARRRAETDIETAWSATRAARLRFEAIDGLARPAAAEAAEMTRIGYTEGRLDLFRLLDAERALNDAERDRADAYQDWGIAFADLERFAPEAAP